MKIVKYIILIVFLLTSCGNTTPDISSMDSVPTFSTSTVSKFRNVTVGDLLDLYDGEYIIFNSCYIEDNTLIISMTGKFRVNLNPNIYIKGITDSFITYDPLWKLNLTEECLDELQTYELVKKYDEFDTYLINGDFNIRCNIHFDYKKDKFKILKVIYSGIGREYGNLKWPFEDNIKVND